MTRKNLFRSLTLGALSLALSLGVYGASLAKPSESGRWPTLSPTSTRSANYHRLHSEPIDISFFNTQNYGPKKMRDPEFMREIEHQIRDSDLFIAQEVRGEIAANRLCELVADEYGCRVSSPAGESKRRKRVGKNKKRKYVTKYNGRKERMVVLYRRGVMDIRKFIDYNRDPKMRRRFSRPPVEMIVHYGRSVIGISTIHTKPEDASAEIARYLSLINDERLPWLHIGDFNECNPDPMFKGLHGLIGGDYDTTNGKNKCAYSAAFGNDALEERFEGNYIVDTGMSDHYLIGVTLKDIDGRLP